MAKLTIARRTLPTVMFWVPFCMGTGLSFVCSVSALEGSLYYLIPS